MSNGPARGVFLKGVGYHQATAETKDVYKQIEQHFNTHRQAIEELKSRPAGSGTKGEKGDTGERGPMGATGPAGKDGVGGTTDHHVLTNLTTYDDHTQYLLKTGGTMTGALTIDGSADAVQLRVQGNATQTNPILQVEDSAGASLLKVAADGQVSIYTGIGISAGASSSKLISAVGTFNNTGSAQQIGACLFQTTFTGNTSGGQQAVRFHVTANGGASGPITALSNNVYCSAAQSGTAIACANQVNTTHTSGIVSTIFGGQNYISCTGSGGITTSAYALWCGGNVGLGATVTNLYELMITDLIGTGSIGTLHGIHINQLMRGSSNYQIYSVSGNMYFGSCNIATDTTGGGSGISLGASANQLVSCYGVPPVVQSGAIVAPTGGTTIDSQARTAINAIRTAIRNFGITA